MIVKNGRRNLSFTRKREPCDESRRVTHAEEVSVAALDMLVRVRECQVRRREYARASGSCFVDAVLEYAQAMNILKSLDGLTCAGLGQDLRALLWDLMNSVKRYSSRCVEISSRRGTAAFRRRC